MNLNNINNSNLQTYVNNQNESSSKTNKEAQEQSLQETLEESAVKVSISMNAQTVLFSMQTAQTNNLNTFTQASLSKEHQEMIDFLSGKEASNGLDLEDIGYTGKPILELSQEEASQLVSKDGFFGIEQTSSRVSNFVFSFAQNDLELLQKGREGIVQGFEEAKKLFGGELPEISYKTQEQTLALIDEKINSLSNNE